MKIQQILIHPWKIPFQSIYQTAAQSYIHREGYIIEIRSDDGLGVGEAAPLPVYSPDTLQQCCDGLAKFREEAVRPNAETDVEKLKGLLQKHCAHSPSAWFGVETALFDLAARQQNLPLARYLNSKAAHAVPVNAIHPAASDQLHGVDTVKVKMASDNLFDNLSVLDKICRDYPDYVRFRLDFNGGLDLPRAIRFAREAEKYPIDYLEQPLPADALEDLAELRFHTDFPIALDESVTDSNSLDRILRHQAADVIVIKPTVTGSYDEIRKMKETAESENISVVFTSTLETAVGRSAVLHLAAAHRILQPCGLLTGHLFKQDWTSPPTPVEGSLRIDDGDGLGWQWREQLVDNAW